MFTFTFNVTGVIDAAQLDRIEKGLEIMANDVTALQNDVNTLLDAIGKLQSDATDTLTEIQTLVTEIQTLKTGGIDIQPALDALDVQIKQGLANIQNVNTQLEGRPADPGLAAPAPAPTPAP